MTTTGRHALPPTVVSRRAVRGDIQALRAVAVLMVVIYHLWPAHITGGYAGVDVFFVISGYLITAHLLREVDRDGRVRLAAFWARRIRRLLPAALLVLLVSAIGVLAFVPGVHWQQFFREIMAAASYVLNWTLAANAVDYLAAENIASPAQHYWSLSVEEQFYVVWPLLVLLGIGIASRLRSQNVRRPIAVVLVTVTVLSFAFSVYSTLTDPAAAYFITPTRAWEFGVGGLLALFAARLQTSNLVVRTVVGWLGWAAILTTAFAYTAQTPFPGYTALLPALGTAAVIWAGEPDVRWAPTRALRIRPVRYLGDISYSLYLWHWPIIVIGGFALASPLTDLQKVLILASSIVLAGLTKKFIEDPFRKAGTARKRATLLAFVGAVAGMAIVLGTSGSALIVVGVETARANAQLDELIKGQTACLGAAAAVASETDGGCENPALDGKLVPDVTGLLDDIGEAYDCYDREPIADVTVCTYGSTKPDALRVALVGDSHAAMLIPGLRPQLDRLNWSLDTYVARGCTWTDVTEIAADDPCRDRQLALANEFETGEKYDAIIVTNKRGIAPFAPVTSEPETTALTVPAEVAGQRFADAWVPVLDRGTQIFALVDNPSVEKDELACVAASNGTLELAEQCVMTQDEAFPSADPLRFAVDHSADGATLIDLTDLYCSENACPMVIGHVITYRDEHHITATFSKTMAPYLLNRMQKELTSNGS